VCASFQYCSAALFESQRETPPVYKNSPPVAGAIAWANSLYQRQKRPILRFKTMPSLFNSPEGEALRKEYLVFAKSVDSYIKRLYGAWCERVKASTSDLLRQPVLGPALLSAPLQPRDVLPEGRAVPGIAVATAAAAAAAITYPQQTPQDRDALRLPLPPYTVNFAPELSTMVRECRLLDRMGYPIPEVAMNVALQVGGCL
jgi:dynein heavy chain